MIQAILREGLQLVRHPVAEIQRSRRTKLKGIPSRRNMLKMQLRPAADHPLNRIRLQTGQSLRLLFHRSKKYRIPQQGHFHPFNQTSSHLPRR